MQTQSIGASNLISTRLSYGCWRLAGSENGPRVEAAASRAAVIAAIEAGYTLFDHADIYGRGECERRFGAVLREMPAAREHMLITSKCGIRPPWDGAQHCYDSSKAHISASVENALERLGIMHLDLLMLHRPDYLADPAEIAATFTALRDAGKVRWFGVSNFRPSQYDALQRACGFPLIVNQVEISLAAQFTLDDGTLDHCLAHQITPLAWSPLAKGTLTAPATDERNPALHETLNRIAASHNTTPACIALAWLLHHPAKIIPIVGSVNPARIREATTADNITLTRTEWYALLTAARGTRLP